MTGPGDSQELLLIENLKNNDKAAFTLIFTRFYKNLVHFSYTYTRNPDISEEIVQDVFLKLWENRSTLHIQTSLKSYLLKTVQNKSIDWMRHLNIRENYASFILNHPALAQNNTEDYVLHADLESAFKRALNKLPALYAEAYKMNRIEALNYAEIAGRLGVSVRTVEVRIGKALILLHDELKDYLFTLFILYSLLQTPGIIV
ncbi:MAG: RNA polymerase sigma-70 factor [Bacteroidales bacterium]|nr:RNA polymerase sigma-70 factor [Bacteroidales bacterium]